MTDMFIAAFWLTLITLAYVYVGYPCLLALAATLMGRRSRKKAEDSSQTPMVSIVIPAHNEEAVIAQKLLNARAVDYPPDRIEFVLVDDASSDSTAEIARRYVGENVRLVSLSERRGKAGAVNEGVRESSGEVLVLCDANVMFAPDAVRHLVSGLEHDGVGAVSGDVRVLSQDSSFGVGEQLYYAFERSLQRVESRVGSVMGVDGGMYAIRRGLFRPLAEDTILDDFAVTMNVVRQGRRVVYEPAAVATENGTPLARQEFQRRIRLSAGAVQSILRGQFPLISAPVHLWQYLSHKLLRWLTPFLMLALLASSIALWRSHIVYQSVLILQVTWYVLATLGAVSVSLRKTRIFGFPFYVTMTLAAMVVGSAKGLFKKQPSAWTPTERTSCEARPFAPKSA